MRHGRREHPNGDARIQGFKYMQEMHVGWVAILKLEIQLNALIPVVFEPKVLKCIECTKTSRKLFARCKT